MPAPTTRLLTFFTILAALTSVASGQVDVLTDNYGNDRSNANLQETTLTAANVAPGNFGRLGSFPVDGQVYAQPLYVSGVSIPGKGTHNVLYVVTEHNSVFAYDADAVLSPNLLWQVNLGASVPNTLFAGFSDVAPEIGILSTGAIDRQAGALYVVAETLKGSTPLFQLHALDIGSGKELMNGPATITAQVAGSGEGANNGTIVFDPSWEIQRPGLLLANGSVYFTFGSHADQGPWHGWMFQYNASDLRQAPGVFMDTLTGVGGAIWQSGRGLAADDGGNVYAISGNGDYDGSTNFAESFLKISGQLSLQDWFTPSNWQYLSENDSDLSAGPGLIPGTHLVVGGDKYGNLYVVNGDAMGSGTGGNAQIFQAVQNGGIFNFAIWNKGSVAYLYMPELFAYLKCYPINGGTLDTAPVSLSSGTPLDNPYLGMSISANGGQDGTGVLWVTTGDHSNANLPGTLHAFDASNLGNELWNSDMTQGQDFLGTFAKFANPTVANGKVYVPTWSNAVTVYGLLATQGGGQSTPAIAAVNSAASYAAGAVSPGGIVTIFGQNLANPGSTGLGLQLDTAGNVSSLLGNSLVLFDGLAAPMIYAAPNQVSAIVPFEVSTSTTQVQVEYAGQMSNTLTVPVTQATPGIFTANGTGSGAAAALNADYSLNSTDNPAAAGSVMILYATGAGQTNPPGVDGALVSGDNVPQPVLGVAVQVGGQPASVLYAGDAPGEVQGMLQVNIQLPAGVTGSNVPVMLTVGSATSKAGVTVAIQ